MIYGIDAYHGNATLPENWQRLTFMIHKVTESNTYADLAYLGRRAGFRSDGVWGGYHAHNADVDINRQVQFFLSRGQFRPGDLLALDLEDFGSWHGHEHDEIAWQATVFMQGIKKAYPRNRTLLYCNLDVYRNIVVPFKVPVGDGLWLATRGQTTNIPPWVINQYGVNNVDLDRANFATLQDMRHWALGAPADQDEEPTVSSCYLTPGWAISATRGTDGYLWLRFMNEDGTQKTDADGQPYGWTQVRPIDGPPSVASQTGKDLQVVYRAADGTVALLSTDDVFEDKPSRLSNLGGVAVAAPNAIAKAGHIVITVEGLKGEIYNRSWDGKSWSPWADLHGQAHA